MPSDVIAILCSDLHLSHRAPKARKTEPDWYDAMRRVVKQLHDIQQEYHCPILFAGDLFDHWNQPPELINWAIDLLPPMLTIPGQHDLPLHRLADKHKSAYYTMPKACVTTDIVDPYWFPIMDDGSTALGIYPFPWGVPLVDRPALKPRVDVHIALVHKYVWYDDNKYQGAPDESHCHALLEKLKGYDIIVVGDNHKGFIYKHNGTTICNCGTMMRRKTDEVGYKPFVGLLHKNKEVTKYYLSTKKDVIDTTVSNKQTEFDESDIMQFIHDVRTKSFETLSFKDAVLHCLEQTNYAGEVCESIIEVMDQYEQSRQI